MTKLDKNSFRPLFNTWWSKIEKFFDSGGFDPIYDHLKFQTGRGIKIYPSSENVFRAFSECDINDLRLIIVGMCPYHSSRNNSPIADGLCLSCGITKYPQPSLDFFTRAIEKELYNDLCLPCVKNPDLTYLANREGILLLNAGLTVEANKPGSNNSLWESFMKYLFENVLDVSGVPILLMGREAQKLEKYINPFNTVIKVSHPISTAYKGESEWNSEGCFKQIQEILKYRNNEKINWFDTEDIPF